MEGIGGWMSGGGERAVLGLGSNQGDRRRRLAWALGTLAERWGVAAVSSVYETEPVSDRPGTGGPSGDGMAPGARFLNLCVILRHPPAAERLLEALLSLEERAGRPREPGRRRGDRPLDLDLLLYGERRIDREGLVVPHPRMTGRAFVMVPLAEVAGGWTVPGTGRTVAEIAAGLDAGGLQRAGSGSRLLGATPSLSRGSP